MAMIRGTKSEDVIKVLEMIHLSRRKTVKEVTLDLSPTMMRIVRTTFPNATMTNDRFRVQKLFYEAIDELRITYRWMARDLENDEIQRCKEQNIEYVPFRYTNGDTRKQLLARAKHVLVKHFSKWTESQRIRAEIIFDHYPELKSVYDLAIELTNIYNNYYETILNYFVNRETNAFAESFNAKIKAFRAQFRGVRRYTILYVQIMQTNSVDLTYPQGFRTDPLEAA